MLQGEHCPTLIVVEEEVDFMRLFILSIVESLSLPTFVFVC